MVTPEVAAALAAAARAILALALGPLAVGITKRMKARCQGRRGPPLLQGYLDLAKWVKKEVVVSAFASPLFLAVPWILLGSVGAAAALSPVGPSAGPALGDLFAVAGLLALGRFLLALAGLETASAFGGMASSREMALSSLVEPGLVLALAAPALAAGGTSPLLFGAAAAGGGFGPGLLLAAAGLLALAVAETGRIPIDNPDTHLELTMVHEGMLLEYAGRHLAAAHLAAAAKQVVVLSLLAALLPPWGGSGSDAAGAAVAAWTLGAAVWAAKVAALSAALGLIESAGVKMRLFRVPEVLGAAFLLGLAGAFLAGAG